MSSIDVPPTGGIAPPSTCHLLMVNEWVVRQIE